MSSTAVVAIFIPVVLRISQNRGTSASRLMMPLSFAALISGMLTLVATAPNLVVNAELIRQGAQGFGFFSFTPFGLPLLALGIVYMLFARSLLAPRTEPPARRTVVRACSEWIEQYSLAEREKRARVSSDSPLVGKRLDELSLRSAGVNILAIERGTGFAAKMLRPTAATELRLTTSCSPMCTSPSEGIDKLWHSLKLEPLPLERDRELFRRPFSGDWRGGSHPAGRIQADRPNRARSQSSLRIRPHRHRLAARQQGGRTRTARGEAEDRRHSAADRLLVRHSQSPVRYGRHRRTEHAGGTAGRSSCRAAGAACAGRTRAGGRADDKRPGAERSGRADRLPADGAFRLRRFQQRLPLHQLEEPRPDRRHVAVLAGLAEDGRGRPRCRRGGQSGRRRRAASRAGDLVRHHRGARPVHLQYGHGRADGARGAGHRQGSREPRPIRSR